MEREPINKRITRLRKNLNLTQPEMAEKLEKLRIEYYPDLKQITRNDVANWEADQGEHISKRTLIKASDVHLLSMVLNEDCDYIITGIRKADKTIASKLGLSQKLIDQLKKENHDQGWARSFNFFCDNDCFDIMESLVGFLHESFEENYNMVTFRLISKLIEEGKIDKDLLDDDYKNFIAHEAADPDRMYIEADRFKEFMIDEHERIHGKIPEKITIIKRKGNPDDAGKKKN